MSDYGFAFAMLPLAFLAAICTASGLRAAYVCRVPGDASVWFEGTAVLLACDLLLDCLDMRAAAVHIAVRGLHPLLLIPALGLSFAGLWHLCRREMRTLIKGRCIAQAALLFAAAVLALGALSNHFPWSTPMAISLAAPASRARTDTRRARHVAGGHSLRTRRWAHRPGKSLDA